MGSGTARGVVAGFVKCEVLHDLEFPKGVSYAGKVIRPLKMRWTYAVMTSA